MAKGIDQLIEEVDPKPRPSRGKAKIIQNAQPVKVIDFNMGFGSMVMFMVKWSIASIPAMIILFLIILLLMFVFGISIGGLSKILI